MTENGTLLLYTPKKFVPCCTKKKTDLLAKKICLELHHILVLLSEIFTIFWYNSPVIMVQLRTNFCSQQISASFWYNIAQNFLECTIQVLNSITLYPTVIPCQNCFFKNFSLLTVMYYYYFMCVCTCAV